MNYTCPVCGYDRLDDPPADYNICECCGTEFGYHDSTFAHAELRDRWVRNGARWHSRAFPPPSGWSAHEQLVRAGHLPEAARLEPAGRS
jgi:hypothetical protein